MRLSETSRYCASIKRKKSNRRSRERRSRGFLSLKKEEHVQEMDTYWEGRKMQKIEKLDRAVEKAKEIVRYVTSRTSPQSTKLGQLLWEYQQDKRAAKPLATKTKTSSITPELNRTLFNAAMQLFQTHEKYKQEEIIVKALDYVSDGLGSVYMVELHMHKEHERMNDLRQHLFEFQKEHWRAKEQQLVLILYNYWNFAGQHS